VRECLEETGYTVEPLRFAALMEEICDSAFIRETYPEYAHKMLHFFICRLASRDVQKPTERQLADCLRMGRFCKNQETPPSAQALNTFCLS
jgi:8-oxo-dGTP pyrophosphatase MutT (NUDIX family)